MFSAHGSFKIARHKNVLIVWSSGAWNLETVNEYAAAAAVHTMPIIDKPWSQISNISEWELATPDVEPVIARLLREGSERGLCREAVINDAGTVKLEQFDRSKKVVIEGFKRRFFTCYKDAAAWLREEGFDAPDESEIVYADPIAKGV